MKLIFCGSFIQSYGLSENSFHDVCLIRSVVNLLRGMYPRTQVERVHLTQTHVFHREHCQRGDLQYPSRREEALKMAEPLWAARDSENTEAIKQQTMRLETAPTFLYKLVNKAMGERPQRRYRDTLGLYSYLLRKYLRERAPQLKVH